MINIYFKISTNDRTQRAFYLWKSVISNTVIYITTEDERYEREIKFSMKQLPTTLPFKIEWTSRCTKYCLFHFWPSGGILFVDKTLHRKPNNTDNNHYKSNFMNMQCGPTGFADHIINIFIYALNNSQNIAFLNR